MKTIIFTDLDGTLLDPFTYSPKKVMPLLKVLKKRKIPLVFCTCKTQAENEYYQKRLKIKDPFIVENGGAIFIPKKYFSFSFPHNKSSKEYFIIELGANYKEIREAFKKIKKETRLKIKGFGDMTAKEVAKDSGLTIKMAELAKKKKYNESFKFEEPREAAKLLFRKIKEAGFNGTHGGKYYNIFGKNTDKGKAVRILRKLFKKEFKNVRTIGLGDGLNDFSMLRVVDVPILVEDKIGAWNPHATSPRFHRIKGIGPEGWIRAINKFILNEHT